MESDPVWDRTVDEDGTRVSDEVGLLSWQARLLQYENHRAWLPSPRETVLDAGCGDGNMMPVFMADDEVRSYVGCDASAGMLKRAEDEHSARADLALLGFEYEFEQAGVYDLPYDNDQFDLVWCQEVLHHLPLEEDDNFVPEQVIRELTRVGKSAAIHHRCHFGDTPERRPSKFAGVERRYEPFEQTMETMRDLGASRYWVREVNRRFKPSLIIVEAFWVWE